MINKRNMKGQLTFTNLITVFTTIVLYVVGLYPILNSVLTTAILDLQADPQPWTSTQILLYQLIPIAIPLGLIAVIFMYSTPRQEYVS